MDIQTQCMKKKYMDTTGSKEWKFIQQKVFHCVMVLCFGLKCLIALVLARIISSKGSLHISRCSPITLLIPLFEELQSQRHSRPASCQHEQILISTFHLSESFTNIMLIKTSSAGCVLGNVCSKRHPSFMKLPVKRQFFKRLQ